MVDQRGLLMRLELHLKRGFGVGSGSGSGSGFGIIAVLAEQHPAGGGLFGHLLHYAQAPPGGFQLQNKGTGEHDFLHFSLWLH